MEFSSEATQPAAPSSTTFDPNAVTPAFARSPSTTSAHHAPASANSTGASISRLSIPALGESTLMGELPSTDPLSILLQKHLPPRIRPVRDLSGAWHASSIPTASAAGELPDPFSLGDQQHSQNAVTQETVRQAAATNSWRKIAMLARAKIEEYGTREKEQLYNQQHQQNRLVDTLSSADSSSDAGVEEVLEWWSVRLYSLARLRLYSMLQNELAAVWQIVSTTPIDGDGAGAGTGAGAGAGATTMLADTALIPFSLRVVRATESKFRGDIRTTVEQYTLLVQLCKAQMKRLKAENASGEGGDAVEVWRQRAVHIGLMLGCTLAEAKDFTGAIELLTPLVESMLSANADQGEEEVERRVQLVVVASRVWVQAGDFTTATLLLDRACGLLPSTSPLQGRITHSKSLIGAIEGDYSSFSSPSPTAGEGQANQEIAERLNSAVITFYAAKLDTAIATLETVLQTDPALVAGADAVIFNTATLYELGMGGDREVVDKKRELLANVARWAGEPGPSGSSFKL